MQFKAKHISQAKMTQHYAFDDMISIQERIEEWNGRIGVKKRSNETTYKLDQQTVNTNEEMITRLRQQVREQRQQLSKMMRKDFEVIQTALGDPKFRFQQLQCQRYDFNTAQKELNEDWCHDVKRLNHYVFQKNCRMRRLDTLMLKLRDFNFMETSKFEREDNKELRRLKSEIDKMNMKCETAKYIQSTYLKTVNELNRAQLGAQNKLDALEMQVITENEELTCLKAICKRTLRSRDRARLSCKKEALIKARDKSDRETILKKLLRRRKHSVYNEDAFLQGNTNFGVMDRKQKPAIRHTLQSNAKLNDLENLFTEFKDKAAVSSVKKIPELFFHEINTLKRLANEANDRNQKLEDYKKLFSETQARMEAAKYRQQSEIDQLSKEIDSLKEEVERKTSNISQIERQAKMNEQLSIDAFNIVNYIISLSEQADFNDDESYINFNQNRLTVSSLQSESLRGAMEKLSRRLQLAKSLDTKNPRPTESLMTRPKPDVKFKLPHQEDDENDEAFFVQEDNKITNEEYLTRETIKARFKKMKK